MRVLGIETSCDDTAAAVVEHGPDGPVLLSNVVAAQEIHGEFGGVVPELASRAHLELLPRTVERALAEAGLGFADIDGIAVTRAPGLLGALLVGVCYAKALALALDRPFVGVNHIEAHLLAPLLEGARLDLPAVGAVVSGGHSEIFVVHAIGRYSIVGTTRDDAIGEAFDKVAKLLGLGFPGGPIVDRLAQGGDAKRYPLPRGMRGSDDFDLSYSGLKSAVRRLVERTPEPRDPAFVADLCASFQVAAVDALLDKVEAAARAHGARSLVVGGGVAQNSRLRAGLAAMGRRLAIPAYSPGPSLCADNGAMIALVGGLRLLRGERDGLDLEPIPGLDDSGLLTAPAKS
ncbi:MAG: tRNA (adenosine(37)-N6)-threonylcarbamoyltransferase complex transferase subunit TsaD [Candidatus Eisenbacteria bacterium]